MGPSWDRQDQGGPHVCPVNFAIWDAPICHHPDGEALSLRLRNIPTQWLPQSFIASLHIISMRRNIERPVRAVKMWTLSYGYFWDIIQQNSTTYLKKYADCSPASYRNGHYEDYSLIPYSLLKSPQHIRESAPVPLIQMSYDNLSKWQSSSILAPLNTAGKIWPLKPCVCSIHIVTGHRYVVTRFIKSI